MKKITDFILEKQEINEGFKEYFSNLLKILTGKKDQDINAIKQLKSGRKINLFIKKSGAMHDSVEWLQTFVKKLDEAVDYDMDFFVWDAREVKPIYVSSIYHLTKKNFSGPGADLTALYEYIHDNFNTADGEGDKKWLNIVLLDNIDVNIVRTDKEVSNTYFYAERYNGNKNVFVKLEDIKY